MNDIEAADARAQYDAEVKKILTNKEILAWFLQYCVDDWRNFILCVIWVFGIEEKAEAKGMAKGTRKGQDDLASLLRKLTPGSEDFNMAISENPEDREIVFKKYGMAE